MRRAQLLLFATLLNFPQSGTPPRASQPHSKVSCVARNQQVVIVDRTTGKTTESDDWIVDCTITVDEHVIWAKPLVLGHPCDFRTAMDSIDEFRNKTAVRIIKDYRK